MPTPFGENVVAILQIDCSSAAEYGFHTFQFKVIRKGNINSLEHGTCPSSNYLGEGGS